MRKSRIAESIMIEYERKKRFERKKQKKELEKFIIEKCINCKNKNTDKCNIKKDIDGNLKCVYYEI